MAGALREHFGITSPTYLDVGANDPVRFNNTYFFYVRGAAGVLVEPDPDLAEALRRTRPRDSVVNVGASDTAGERDFYLVSPSALNTFSAEEFEQVRQFYPETRLRAVVRTPTVPLRTLMTEWFDAAPDLVSIDVEGMDFDLVASMDLGAVRPKVLCVESVRYERGDTWVKPAELLSYLYERSYFLYADTFINSIFIDEESWRAHGQPALENFYGR